MIDPMTKVTIKGINVDYKEQEIIIFLEEGEKVDISPAFLLIDSMITESDEDNFIDIYSE
jgi:hypothetical protein